MLAKVLNNYVAAVNVVAVRRCISHAERFAFDYRKLIDVMNQSSGGNWFAANIDEIDWSRESYSPANTIGILEKDVNSALDMIRSDAEQDTAETINGDFDDALLQALRDIPVFPDRH